MEKEEKSRIRNSWKRKSAAEQFKPKETTQLTDIDTQQ
jgi:hypothetical protein